jgi:hypothetical protein
MIMDFEYFPILLLTPDEPIEITYTQEDLSYFQFDQDTPDDLLEILPLTPDITSTTDDNQLYCEPRLFFEELGVLTEEPEPIDPNRDYGKEFEVQQQELQAHRRSHQRRNAKDASTSLNSLPSLAYSDATSAASSTERKKGPQPHDMIFRRPCHMHEITFEMKGNTAGPLPGDLISDPSAYLYEETYR